MSTSWVLVAGGFVFGAIFGSFAGVVIYRFPEGRSIVSPGSSCGSCGAAIRWWDNIPLVSFAALGGRCRACRARISPRYPLIELLTALSWAGVAWRIGWRPALPAFLVLATSLVILSFIDLAHKRLPSRILIISGGIAAVLLLGAAAAGGRWDHLARAGEGAALYGVPMLALGLLVPAGMGGGDIKFAPYLGLHLGWLGLGEVGVGAMLAFILGGISGVALMLAGRKGGKDKIPFGPFMALGALLAVLFGGPIMRLWLGS